MTPPGVTDVVVVGSGIIGVLCGWRLSRAGLRVTLLHSPEQAGTTTASAAVVRVLCDQPHLVLPSLAWYQQWSDALPGPPVFHRSGVTVVVPPALAESVTAAHQAIAEIGTGPAPRRVAPSALPAGYRAAGSDAWFEPGSGYADPHAMVTSLRKALAGNGGRLIPAKVTRMVPDGGCWRIATDHGEIRSERVIVAAGAATPALLPATAISRPVRRALVRVGMFERHAGVTQPVVDLAHGLLIRPHQAGLLATTRAAGDDFLSDLRAAATGRLPMLTGSGLREHACSEFDVTDDGKPLVGAAGPGLFVAYGFGGKGFKTAPELTAALVDTVLTGTSHPLLRDFDPLRRHAAARQGPLTALA